MLAARFFPTSTAPSISMKRIRISITQHIEVPDGWEITDDPDEETTCVQGPAGYFIPTLSWLEREVSAGGRVDWASASDEAQSVLIEGLRLQEDTYSEVER